MIECPICGDEGWLVCETDWCRPTDLCDLETHGGPCTCIASLEWR